MEQSSQDTVTLSLGLHRLSQEWCRSYIDAWRTNLLALPPVVALLPVSDGDTYRKVVGPKTRNMIRKARRHNYYFSQFWFNKHIEDMHEINTSKAVRQGIPMTASYITRPQPIREDLISCSAHEQVYLGVFTGQGKLVAYCWLAICGDVAVLNRVIGHSEHLQNGVMNQLFVGTVEHCYLHTKVKYVNYRTMESATEGLQAFKKHVGFKPTRLVVTY